MSFNHLLHNKYLQLLVISSSIFGLDQVTKNWVRDTIHETGPIPVIPGFFRIVHVENAGAAWGILSDASFRMPFFYASTLIALTAIGIFFSRLGPEHRVLRLALSVVLGGALGNFLDRVLYQSVTDFLDFFVAVKPVSAWLISTFGTNRWPSFNVADVAIVVGLGLVMFDAMILEPQRIRKAEAEGQGPAGGGDEPASTGRLQTTLSTVSDGGA